jgi:hypothetical protein
MKNFYEFHKIMENKESEAAALWKANGKIVRAGYLSGHPLAQEYSEVEWELLPLDVKKVAMKSMFSNSPFKIN